MTLDLSAGESRRNETLRSLTDAMSEHAVAVLDAAGRIITWSGAARMALGFEEADVVGGSFARLYAPEDVRGTPPGELLRQAAESGRVEARRWCVRQDGSRFWGEVVLSSVRDDSGAVLGYVHLVRDPSTKTEAEDRSRLIVESVKDYAIFMLDADGRIATWNPGAERAKGYRAEEIIGKHVSVFYTPEDLARQRPMKLLRLAALNGRVEDEGWRLRKDGSRFWADVIITRVQDATGRLVGFAKVTRDLTARKQAEEERAARTRQQAAISEIGLFALETRDLDTVLERAARIAASTLDADMADVFELSLDGRSFVLRAAAGLGAGLVGRGRVPTGSESQPGYTLLAGECMTQDSLTERRFAMPPLFAEQSVRSAVSVVIRAPGHAGRPYGVFDAHAKSPRAFSRDDLHFMRTIANVIAAAIVRRRAEEQTRIALQQAEIERGRTAEARTAVQARDDLISVAAHELRTPLMGLRLNLLSMERALKSAATEAGEGNSPLIRRRIENGLQHTERLTALIERLLDLPRIATGQFHLALEPIDVATLARETVEGFQDAALKAGSSLRVHAPEPATGSFDRSRIQEVLENLLSNAIKYGEGRPIEVAVEPVEDAVRIRVSDHGGGIPPDDLGRIFEQFHRAPTASSQPGIGLGLYVTRHIIEAHGGTIAVSSHVGEGTVFTVELPRAGAAADTELPAPPSQASP